MKYNKNILKKELNSLEEKYGEIMTFNYKDINKYKKYDKYFSYDNRDNCIIIKKKTYGGELSFWKRVGQIKIASIACVILLCLNLITNIFYIWKLNGVIYPILGIIILTNLYIIGKKSVLDFEKSVQGNKAGIVAKINKVIKLIVSSIRSFPGIIPSVPNIPQIDTNKVPFKNVREGIQKLLIKVKINENKYKIELKVPSLKIKFINPLAAVCCAWEGFKKLFNMIYNKVIKPFVEICKKLWAPIEQAIIVAKEKILDPIISVIMSIWNTIKKFFEGVIDGFIEILGFLDWVPGLGTEIKKLQSDHKAKKLLNILRKLKIRVQEDIQKMDRKLSQAAADKALKAITETITTLVNSHTEIKPETRKSVMTKTLMDLHKMLDDKVKGVVELPVEGKQVEDDAKESFDNINEELDVEAKIKQARDLGAMSNSNTEMNSSTDVNDNEEGETSSYDFKVDMSEENKQTSSYDYVLNDEGKYVLKVSGGNKENIIYNNHKTRFVSLDYKMKKCKKVLNNCKKECKKYNIENTDIKGFMKNYLLLKHKIKKQYIDNIKLKEQMKNIKLFNKYKYYKQKNKNFNIKNIKKNCMRATYNKINNDRKKIMKDCDKIHKCTMDLYKIYMLEKYRKNNPDKILGGGFWKAFDPREWARGAWNGFKSGINSAKDTLSGWWNDLKKAFEKIPEFFKDIWNTIKKITKIGEIFTKIWDGIKFIGKWIVNELPGFFKKILKIILNVGELIGWFIGEFIKRGIKIILAVIEFLVQLILETLKAMDIPGWASPSNPLLKLPGILSGLVKLLDLPFKDFLEQLVETLEKLLSNIPTKWATDIIDVMKGIAQDCIAAFKNSYDLAMDGVRGAINAANKVMSILGINVYNAIPGLRKFMSQPSGQEIQRRKTQNRLMREMLIKEMNVVKIIYEEEIDKAEDEWQETLENKNENLENQKYDIEALEYDIKGAEEDKNDIHIDYTSQIETIKNDASEEKKLGNINKFNYYINLEKTTKIKLEQEIIEKNQEINQYKEDLLNTKASYENSIKILDRLKENHINNIKFIENKFIRKKKRIDNQIKRYPA